MRTANNIKAMIDRSYHKYMANNEIRPNILFISVDLFHDFVRSYEMFTENMVRDIENPNRYTCMGLDVAIIENKRDFILVARDW